LKALNYRICKS